MDTESWNMPFKINIITMREKNNFKNSMIYEYLILIRIFL